MAQLNKQCKQRIYPEICISGQNAQESQKCEASLREDGFQCTLADVQVSNFTKIGNLTKYATLLFNVMRYAACPELAKDFRADFMHDKHKTESCENRTRQQCTKCNTGGYYPRQYTKQ